MKSLADLPDDIVEMLLHYIGTREKHRLLASGDARFAWRLHRRTHKFQLHMRDSGLLLPLWSHLRELKLTYELVKSNPFKIPSPTPLFQSFSSSSTTTTPPFTISTTLPNLSVLKINWNSAFWLSDLGAQNCAAMFPNLRFLYLRYVSQNGSPDKNDFAYLKAWPMLDTLQVDLHHEGERGAIGDEILYHLPPNLKRLKLPSMGHKALISYTLPETLTHLDVGELEFGFFPIPTLPLLHTLCVDTVVTDDIFRTPLPTNITSFTIRRESRTARFTLDKATALLSPSIKNLSIPFIWPLVFLSTAFEFSVDVFSTLTRLDFEGTETFQTFIAAKLYDCVNLVELRMLKSEKFPWRIFNAYQTSDQSIVQPMLNDNSSNSSIIDSSYSSSKERSSNEPLLVFSLPPSLRHLTIGISEGMFLENLFATDNYEDGALFRCKTLQSLHIIVHPPWNLRMAATQALSLPQRSFVALSRMIDNIACVNNLENFSLTSECPRIVQDFSRDMSPLLFEKLMSRLQNVRDIKFHNIPFLANDETTIPKSFISKLPRNLKHLDLSNSLERVNVTDQFLKDCLHEMPHYLKTLRMNCFSNDARSLDVAPIFLEGAQKLLPFLRSFQCHRLISHGVLARDPSILERKI